MAVLSGLLRISDGWSEMWENYLFVGWRLFDEIPLRRHGDPRSTVSTLSSKPSSGAFSYLFFKRFSVASISAPPKRIVEIPLPFPPLRPIYTSDGIEWKFINFHLRFSSESFDRLRMFWKWKGIWHSLTIPFMDATGWNSIDFNSIH